MKNSSRSLGFRSLGAVALAGTAALVLAAPARADVVDVNLNCQANAPIVGPQQANLTQGTDVTAPDTVAPGAAFDLVVDPAPNTVPATVAGYKLKQVKNFKLMLPVPANSAYVSAALSGGSGLGSTAPTITVSGGVATLAFAGPIAGGAAFELPTITFRLTAGASGTIETRLAGTSYADPGLTFTSVVNQLIDISAPTACFPDPSPVFTTTTIA
jgi:dehydratase